MITITADEATTICEALRYWAWDINELEYRIAMRSLHVEEKDAE